MPPTREQVTEQIRSAASIVDVVSEHVRLRPSGPQRYMGLCPFHKEKTPSFTVYVPGQFFKCFSCGASGDVFGFVQRAENLGFLAARKELAERYGIALSDAAVNPAVARQQRAYAEQLGAECSWWWRGIRARLVAQECGCYAIQRRAERWLAGIAEREAREWGEARETTPDGTADTGHAHTEARADAHTEDAISYAWWWMIHGGTLAATWGRYVRMIDAAAPSFLLAAYREYRAAHPETVREFERDRSELKRFRDVLMAGIAARAVEPATEPAAERTMEPATDHAAPETSDTAQYCLPPDIAHALAVAL